MASNSREIGFFPGALLERTAREYPEKIALIAREGRLTFGALQSRVAALATHLQQEGIRRGDRVGVLLPNSNAFALGYYATQRVGAVTVVLDARLKGKELEGVLEDADLKLLITHKRLMGDIGEVVREFPSLLLWLVEGEGEWSFENRLSPTSAGSPPEQAGPSDDALILYTSGTTGEPKGVVLSYINLAQFPRCVADLWKSDANTVWGCILPMSHISGPILCNEIIDKGSSVVIMDQFNPIMLLEAIQEHRITIFHAVPPLFQLLLGVSSLRTYDTKSLKVVGMMGTTVPPSLLQGFKLVQPHVSVVQGYGLTETSPLITGVPVEDADSKMTSIGRAVPGAQVRVIDQEGREVPEGEGGEIITCGPHVMKGYFRKSEATAERIRNHWLHTGDIGRRDSDGYFYHLGRKDDLIITGGLNVYPAEVENLLCEHPKVQEAVVFPIEDVKRGSVIGAVVVLCQEEKVTEKELLSFLRSNLVSFKVPQKIVIRDSLPRTSSGKVIRDASALVSGD